MSRSYKKHPFTGDKGGNAIKENEAITNFYNKNIIKIGNRPLFDFIENFLYNIYVINKKGEI